MKKVKRRVILILDILLLLVLICAYMYIFNIEKCRIVYAEEAVKSVEENSKPIFGIDKIVFYASANAVDNSEGELKDINISQYSDFEIYINNKLRSQGLTGENTISELYIDNIKVNKGNNKTVNFNYKNPTKAGKYVDLENWQNDGVLFKVINTNEKNRDVDYNIPVFYTDCSNPISLGCVNEKILEHCEVTDTPGTLVFDGSILKNIHANLDELKISVSFKIHIINNFNEEYVYDVVLNNDLTDKTGEEYSIYSGYLMKIIEGTKDDVFMKTDSKK